MSCPPEPLSPRVRLLHVCTVPQTLAFLDEHVKYAQQRGWEVHAVASQGPELSEFAARTGATVHVVAMERRITPLRDLRALWQLRRVLRQVRPHVVHGHTPKGGLLAMLASWLCRVPVRVYSLLGLPLETATGARRLILRQTESISCALAQRVYCISPSLREIALTEGLCPAGKMTVLHHGSVAGVDARGAFDPAGFDPALRAEIRRQYGIPLDALVVGFIGRLVRDKGVVELARAWQSLRDEFPGARLLLVGPDESHDPTPAEVETLLRGDARVHRTGGVPVLDMPRVYTALDLFVLPTYREGFGTVLVEAAAMGLPLVATRVTGCVDAVADGQTGVLVPPRDAEALARGLRAYLADAELRRRHGAAARARALRDFAPQPLCSALYDDYVQLLRDQGVPVTTTENAPPSFYRRHGKRIVDVVLSATALLLLAPLLLVLALLVRCVLGAPILFRQVRTGKEMRAFTILKFRTMTDARDDSGALLPETLRLTRFGRFLRSTSLDELPELVNVLKGEMSLVGPRPLLPQYDAWYTENEARRFELRPGLTGWAQVNGRNDLPWDDRLARDAWYAGACSFGLDVKIMLLTVVKVLRRDNVQVDPGQTFGMLDEERRARAAALVGEPRGECP